MLVKRNTFYIVERFHILTSILLCKTSNLRCVGASQFNCSNNHARSTIWERERVRAPDQHQSHYVPATTKRERKWNIRKHPTHYLSLKDATKCRQHWMKMAIVKTNGNERKRPSMVLVSNARNEAKTSYETIYPSELCCFFNPFFSLSSFACSILFRL